jgi:Asp-tRNA(Asn)/Glu-tRNA(Gln) amidotransferase A subunit family amidase
MLWTIHAAAEALRNGRLTSRQLLEACFAQIERHESRVHAWVFVDR